MRVFQHIDVYHSQDGIGNDINGLHSVLHRNRIPSFIICRISDRTDEHVMDNFPFPLETFPSDMHILHYGGYGYPVREYMKLKGKKILRYHNMTPPQFFQPFLPIEQYNIFQFNYEKSLVETAFLADASDEIWSDSEYNRDCLLESYSGRDFQKFKVKPIFRKYRISETSKNRYEKTLIFTGRYSPNKKLEDCIYSIFFLRKIDPDFRFIFLGKRIPVFQKYSDFLHRISKELNLLNSVYFIESASDDFILKKMTGSSVYLSCSEHEGFGIPVIEAFGAGLPVIYSSIPALKEITKGAGAAVNKKRFELIAELIFEMHSNSEFRERTVHRQNIVAEYYNSLYESLEKSAESIFG
ncbi:MAG TPA: glycosyltransferase [Leptospiraceae bacterium]|nr:glycosyltransferase [Leptospiraceae bacterium]